MLLVVESKVNASNAKDVENFQRLCRQEKVNGLSKANKKTLVRLQVRLMKQGAIKIVNKRELDLVARRTYEAFPFWKKWHLKGRFLARKFKVWRINMWRRWRKKQNGD